MRRLSELKVLAGLVLLVAISWEILAGHHQAFSRGYLAVQLVVCLLFLCDFFIRWRLAGRKGLFLLRNLLFLLISIPYLNIAVWSHAQLPRYWAMLLGLMPLIRAFDVLGIVALTIITSLSGTGTNLWVVLLKIVVFFATSVVMWIVLHRAVEWWFARYNRDKRRFVVLSFAFCLMYAYLAEELFGVADITGAYIAGLIFANTPRVAYLQDRFETLSYTLLSPIFFANIGLKVVLPEMSGAIILFSVLLVLWAVVSKVIGCGLGSKLCGYNGQDSLRIGVGMISRGEVALIVANNGIAAGLMPEVFFGPVVLMVIATTILTPILLKLVYRGKEKDYSDLQESELVNRYEDAEAFDLAAQALLEDHERLRNAHQKQHRQNGI